MPSLYWSTQIENLQAFRQYFHLRSHSLAEPSPDYFTRVPPDIFLAIARFLHLRELILLRLTCRRFYVLTYEASIWKTRFKEANVLLPQLPPIDANSFERIPSAVCEHVLRRAHAVESEWQRKECRPAHNFFNSLGVTHCMSLLPGGRFLAISSISSTTNQPTLSIWDLEVPTKNPFVPHKRRAALVTTVLPGKVTEMCSKYVPYKSAPGIAIALSGSAQQFGDNSSNYWAVYWAPLEILDDYTKALARPDVTVEQLQATVEDHQGPFITLAKKYTSSQVTSLCLDIVEGNPLVALVRDGKEIVVQYLELRQRSFITPINPWDHENNVNPPWAERGDILIRKIRVLPAQKKILIVREVRHAPPTYPVFWYAIYPLPAEGIRMRNALFEVQFQEGDIKSIDFFSLSDECYRNDSLAFDRSMHPITREQPPMDISIWAVNSGTTASDGLPSVILRRVKPFASPDAQFVEQPHDINNFEYRLDSMRLRFPGDRPIAIAGGARRGLWFIPARNAKPGSMRVGEIVRYLATEMDLAETENDTLQRELVTVKLPAQLLKGLNTGMTAYAFDESIGRLVVTTRDDELVHVLDFGDHVGIDWAPNVCKGH